MQKIILNQNIVILNNIDHLLLKYCQNLFYNYFGQLSYKVVKGFAYEILIFSLK